MPIVGMSSQMDAVISNANALHTPLFQARETRTAVKVKWTYTPSLLKCSLRNFILEGMLTLAICKFPILTDNKKNGLCFSITCNSRGLRI